MPRKRKSGAPQKADEAKRQQMSWNLFDTGDLHVVENSDPALLLERDQNEASAASQAEVEGSKQNLASSEPTAGPSHVPSFIPKRHAKALAEELCSQCDFFLSIYTHSPFKDNDWHCQLGSFKLHLASSHIENKVLSDALLKCTEFWLYVNKQTGKHLVYLEISENDENLADGKLEQRVLYVHATCDLPLECLDAVQLKVFPLVWMELDAETAVMEVRVYGLEGVLTKLQFSSEGTRPKRTHLAVRTLVNYFYKYHLLELNCGSFSRRHDVEELFAYIKEQHDSDPLKLKLNLQHSSLKPRLRDYQKLAVWWMLSKEQDGDVSDADQGLHPLYEDLQTLDGHRLYYNKFVGYLVQEKPLLKKSPPGGILADEMGLGKTVEVLACMLAHPRAKLPLPEPLPVVEPELPKQVLKKTGLRSSNSSRQLSKSRHRSSTGRQQETVDHPESEHSCIDENVAMSVNLPAGITTTVDVLTEEESTSTIPKPSTSVEKTKAEVFGDPLDGLMVDSEVTVTLSDHSYCSPPKAKEHAGEPSVHDGVTQQGDTGTDAKAENESAELGAVVCQLPHTKAETPHSKNPVAVQCQTKTCEAFHAESKQQSKSKRQHKQSKGLSCAKTPPVLQELSLKAEGDSLVSKAGGDARPLGCICGHHGLYKDSSMEVQCLGCGLWQHHSCVGYDLTNPYRGDYLCPHCLVAAPPLPSVATLIISPNSICHQWVEEIQKHIRKDALRVLVYSGVHKKGFIQPRTLAAQDIVITTYETLRKEIDYVDLPHSNSEDGRKFRRPKRFMAIPSPLIAVEWWRICLDEAQMVECTTTKTADMALRLKAVNRWCVTGTPIQKGIDDLYGLLLFLGVEPYWVRQWWSQLLCKPYCHGHKAALQQVAAQILWRTSKRDVIDQICLPVQTEEVHWLTFSPVEEHFYRRQYQDCAREAMQKLSKWTDSEMKLNSLDRYTLHQLLHPLLRLRQACCHPQAVRGSFLPINKSAMTMEELLTQLTKKARLECEESHRQFVAAMNGLAALDIVNEQYAESVAKYREVLMSVEQHRDQLRTDELQQLHAIQNLQEVLALKPAGVDPTLRDSLLEQQAAELRDKYMAKKAAFVKSCEDAWGQARLALRQLQQEFEECRDWWAELLSWVSYMDMDYTVITKVKDDLADNASPTSQSIAFRFRDIRGLQFLIESNLQQLETSHDALVMALQEVSGLPSQDLVNITVECCLRPVGEPLKICAFCKAHEKFEDYESKLFSFVDKGIIESTEGEDADPTYQVSTRRQGTWADSETEKALKSLISFAKSFRASKYLVESGSVHMKILEGFKKEFKCLRLLWQALRERVSCVDELDMATMRLRLRLPDEPVADPPLPNIIERTELEQHKLKLKTEKIVGHNELQKKLGQLLYLKNLRKAQTVLAGGQNPEPCPICQKELGTKWSVLLCGHCFCLECIRIIVDEYSFGGRHRSLKCAICRQRTPHADISYVCTKPRDEAESGEIRVKGDHSTKVEGVIRCLLQIQRDDPEAKALVFSTWLDVLDVLAKALEQNGIEYRSLLMSYKFQDNLVAFKQQANVKVLLLTVHIGSNGLNLIEATHVLLVEPILNAAQELQAVGRVSRIGQTKPTFVHRFLVQHTIEHRMHTLLQTVQAPVNSQNAEETTLTIGDLTSLFREVQEEEEEEGDSEGQEENSNQELLDPSQVAGRGWEGTPDAVQGMAGNQNNIDNQIADNACDGHNSDGGPSCDNTEGHHLTDTGEDQHCKENIAVSQEDGDASLVAGQHHADGCDDRGQGRESTYGVAETAEGQGHASHVDSISESQGHVHSTQGRTQDLEMGGSNSTNLNLGKGIPN